jgi:hypothetical protein
MKDHYSEGTIVRMTDDAYTLRSTLEFIGQEGVIMPMPKPRDEYIRVKFNKKVRGQSEWWVPKSDLEPPNIPSWEV